MFNFKNAEEDHRIAVDALRTEYCARGNAEISWSQLRREAYYPLIHSYVDAGKSDDIIEYVLDQWDGPGGYPYFLEISDALIKKNDRARLISMWRSIIADRKKNRQKKDAIKTMELFLEILTRINETDFACQISEELESLIKPPALIYPDLETRKITTDVFWELIETAKQNAGSVKLRPEELQKLLLRFKANEVKRFDAIMRSTLSQSYTWDLWGVAYIAFGGCGNDDFEYFREWLISEGKEVFACVSANVESLVSIAGKPQKLEGFSQVPAVCYKLKTGKKLVQSFVVEIKPKGNEWLEDELELEKRFPKTYQYFLHEDSSPQKN